MERSFYHFRFSGLVKNLHLLMIPLDGATVLTLYCLADLYSQQIEVCSCFSGNMSEYLEKMRVQTQKVKINSKVL